MSYYQGYSNDEIPPNVPSLPACMDILVLGTAPLGPLGDVTWISSLDQAKYVYGGTQTYRISPSGSQTSLILSGFSPDDPTLNTSTSTTVYYYQSGDVYPVQYPFWSNVSGSGTYPVTAYFDAIGYDPSTQPGPAGIFIQSDSLFTLSERETQVSGVPNTTSLLFPLTAMLREAQFSVAAQRVGSSWLATSPAILLAYVNGVAGSGTGPVLKFYSVGVGWINTTDYFLSCSITTSPSGIVIDPGVMGLPYSYRNYLYSNYASWTDLINDIAQDGQNNIIPYQLVATYNIPIFGVTPSGTGSYTSSPFYPCQILSAPNLTTASGWYSVLSQESIAAEEPAFLICSGLTGEAMAADPESTLGVLQILSDNESSSLCSNGPIIVAPWSNAPPSGIYSSSSDISQAQALSTALGEYANSVLLIWGVTPQISCPDVNVGQMTEVPSAYISIAAILNEYISGGDYLRPELTTALSSAPWFNTGSVSGYGIPNSQQLPLLQSSGIVPITKKIDGTWTLYGPVVTLSGESLGTYLAVKQLESDVQEVADNYIGQPYSTSLQSSLQSDLDSVASNILGENRFVQSCSLTLLQPDVTQPVTSLNITAILNLYGETRSIQFTVIVDF